MELTITRTNCLILEDLTEVLIVVEALKKPKSLSDGFEACRRILLSAFRQAEEIAESVRDETPNTKTCFHIHLTAQQFAVFHEVITGFRPPEELKDKHQRIRTAVDRGFCAEDTATFKG